MAGKQITELESTNKISEGDLLFVRKTTSGTDKKINYTDLVESIGNPAIDGFVAIVDPLNANTIILTPANNARIPRYFVGMKISFVSPITSTGNVKIKVGSLTAKDFVQYQTTSTVILGINDYVEGVFITDKFHRINDLRSVANIYSNEYNVILTTIDPSNQFTILNLVSSIGIPKQSYYDGMAISFITPENTKGVTLIHIDGIPGTKTIFEPDLEDFISLPLYANQIVRAIYKTAQGGFIRDNFQTNDPTVTIPIVPSIDNPDEPYIPPQNIFQFNVGANEKFKNLAEAVTNLTKEFGKDGGGRQVTLLIKDTLTKTSALIISNRKLGWITLRGDNNIINFDLITYSTSSNYIGVEGASECFNIAENTIVTCKNFPSNVTFIHLSSQSSWRLNNVTFKNTDFTPRRLFTVGNSDLEFKNCVIEGGTEVMHITSSAKVLLDACVIKSYQTRALYIDAGSTVTINNCDLSSNGTSAATNINIGTSFSKVDQYNSKAKSNYAPNTGESNGMFYRVTGSQDIQGG